MDKDKIKPDSKELYHLLPILIEAVESGNVNKVRRLLKSVACPIRKVKVSSHVLCNADPLNHPLINADILWEYKEPNIPEEQRPGERTVLSAWKQISRCLNLLLSAGPDPNTTDRHGTTLLDSFGIHKELTEIFNRLLRLGANPNVEHCLGGNSLNREVSIVGNEAHVKLLLDYGAEPDREDNMGDTPLISASNGSSLKIVRKLINAGADVNHHNNEGETPLMCASQSQSLNTLKLLIDAGADVNCRDNMGRTALMHALRIHAEFPMQIFDDWISDCHIKSHPRESSIIVTSLLISAGATIDENDNNGFYTTDYALMAYLNGVELAAGLKINSIYLRFCRAAIANCFSEIASLLAFETIPQRIKTLALHMAATRGYSLSCIVLLENGADANGLNLSGNYPIESAAVGLHLEVVQLIVSQGATLEGINRALLAACMSASHRWPEEDRKTFMIRRLKLARYLLQNGANPNFRDHYGNDVPLKQTIGIDEDCELSLLLLEYGADPSATDEQGETLLEYARTGKMKAILQEWSEIYAIKHKTQQIFEPCAETSS